MMIKRNKFNLDLEKFYDLLEHKHVDIALELLLEEESLFK